MNRKVLRQHIMDTTQVDGNIAQVVVNAMRPRRSWKLAIILGLALILAITMVIIIDRVQDIEHFLGVGWIDQLRHLREQANEVRGVI